MPAAVPGVAPAPRTPTRPAAYKLEVFGTMTTVHPARGVRLTICRVLHLLVAGALALSCSSDNQPASPSPNPNPPPGGNSYTTRFPLTENPISEGGAWTTGKKDGLDWQDIRTAGGVAFGTQSGVSDRFDDSVAVLTGTWGATQTVSATVKVTNPSSTAYEEVELWVRTTISPRAIKGYEVNFRTTSDGSQYIGIVRWLGPLGSPGCAAGCAYEIIGGECFGYPGGLRNGDTIKVTISGFAISAFVNGVERCQRTDPHGTYPSGNPGIGHWFRANGASGLAVSDYGLTSFSAEAS